MSVVLSAMFRDQINSFSRGGLHSGSTPFNELLAQFKTRITTTQNLGPVSPSRSPPGFSDAHYVKKRSYSDRANESDSLLDAPPNKRSRTAPPSPPSTLRASTSFPSDAASSRLKFHPSSDHYSSDRSDRITLPSLSDALSGIQTQSTRPPQKSIVPTVSLDYFDTYKPNDEQWRYGLLDSIKSSKPSFNLSNYSYLGKHATTRQAKSPNSNEKLPPIHHLGSDERPNFDARVSSKALPALAERKINFPYESNYTYLNKTYLTDVERYPEYLELAQSLIQLSRPQQYVAPQPYYPMYKPEYVEKRQQYERSQEETQSHQHDHHHRAQHHNSYQHTERHHHQEPKELSGHEHVHTHIHDRRHQQVKQTQDKYIASQWAPSKEPYFGYIGGSSPSRVPQLSPRAYVTPDSSFEYKPSSPSKKDKKESLQRTRFIPITPPSVKDKSRSELMKSPPRSSQTAPRVCISCGSDQSPCWRPSWSIKEGQLCNSCGLRYKKTSTRCLNDECKKIPAKGEWSLMQTKGKTTFDDGEEAYSCLDCGWKVEVKK
ncbi:CIC11C00000002845 [Sungouiella intermedia]|uniref:CIC11C00000002845 n=1 Tax=Sungouiella intermedia TaxID=45354 RepID=A0A1L0BRY3_9ASCO|nr:CIC11C00000002845 [[Candida] intermedia]